jgi:glycosyltransferase involved in cell wall biosynthesis
MHVGIVADRLGSQGGGVETYERELICGLAEQPGDEQFTVYCASTAGADMVARLGPRFHAEVVNPVSKVARFAVGLPLSLRRSRVDIFHCCLFPPLYSGRRSVFTVHDFSPFVRPEFFPVPIRLRLTMFMRHGIASATRILCVSESTKADLVRLFRIDSSRVSVVHLGVEKCYHPPDPAAVVRIRRQYNLPDRYVLYVGKLDSRKNIVGILRAYYLLKTRYGYGTSYALVLAGRRMWSSKAELSEIGRLGLGDNVRILGHIEHADLPLLYAGAAVFLFPSHYEGFGLPPLEAMACGTPVVTSNVTSLPEIVGDAGVCIAPDDHDAIAQAVHELLSDASLHASRRAMGLTRASEFSWTRTAGETLRVYREVRENA